MMLKVNSNKLKWTEARTSTKVLTVWPICPEINQNVCVFQLPIVVVGGLRLTLVSVGVSARPHSAPPPGSVKANPSLGPSALSRGTLSIWDSTYINKY